MALKYSYANEADIPAEHKALYVKKGDKWVLDAEGVVPREQLDEFRTNNIAIMTALGVQNMDEAKAKLEVLKTVDPKRYKELTDNAAAAEQERLKAAGKFDEALAAQKKAMDEEHQRTLTAEREEKGKLRTRLQTVLIDNEVASAAVAKGVRPEALDDVKARASRVFQLNETNEVVALDDKSKPRFNAKGDPFTIAEFMDELLTKAPHLFEPNGGGGASNQQQRVTGGGENPYSKATWNLTRQAIMERDQPAKAAQMKAAAVK